MTTLTQMSRITVVLWKITVFIHIILLQNILVFFIQYHPHLQTFEQTVNLVLTSIPGMPRISIYSQGPSSKGMPLSPLTQQLHVSLVPILHKNIDQSSGTWVSIHIQAHTCYNCHYYCWLDFFRLKILHSYFFI